MAADQLTYPPPEFGMPWTRSYVYRPIWVPTVLIILVLFGFSRAASGLANNSGLSNKAFAEIPLSRGWALQSACVIHADGTQLSSIRYHPSKWIPASVPTTVLAAQVEAGIYKDPYVGMNLRKIPGTTYPIGARFSNLPMQADSPYRCGWWYRTQFTIPPTGQNKIVWLHFGGINYKANIWVNGHLIANSEHVAGAYRIYDFDISEYVTPGKPAAIAVEVFAPLPTDLGINWVDWNPAPPDKDMGLWGPVSLRITGPVAVRSPFITTHFDDSNLKTANVTVTAELQNVLDHPVRGIVSGTFAGAVFEQPVQIPAKQSMSISFSPAQYPQLKIRNPALWWPAGMGEHPLELLTVRFACDGQTSDIASKQVGIREITSTLTKTRARLFFVNGKPILIRGAGWAPDMMLRTRSEHIPEQIQMVRDMHLNTIRQEGKLETDEFYRLTDKYGILVMAGWCCCDEWEHSVPWAAGINEYHEPDSGELRPWPEKTFAIASASLQNQLMRLRSHPSMLAWLNGSDYPPTPPVERRYLEVEKSVQWPNPIISSAGGYESSLTGPSGIKMTGPYNYVPPSYWETDSQHGGAFGFIAETSPGPSIPLPDSLRRFIPREDLWPIDDVWNYHAGGIGYANLNIFNEAMKDTYGWPDGLVRYSQIAQTMSYDSERAMFEAYGRNKYASTGVIQWMLNNAWPSIIWHLYDYYLQAGGGYYGVKKACEPIHIQYSYDNQTVYVVNSTEDDRSNLTAEIEVYDIRSRSLFHKTVQIDAPADTSQLAATIPAEVLADAGDAVHFVRLALTDHKGTPISRNFYWISSQTTPAHNDFKRNTAEIPAKEYPDMKELGRLTEAHVHINASRTGQLIHVRIANPSNALAFQLQVTAIKTDGGAPILPLSWSDNYVELLPGESEELSAKLPTDSCGQVKVEVSGWNVPTVSTRLSAVGVAGRG